MGFIYTRVNAGGSDPDKTGLWSLPNVHLGEFETSLKNYQRKRTKFQSDTKTSTLSICKRIRAITQAVRIESKTRMSFTNSGIVLRTKPISLRAGTAEHTWRNGARECHQPPQCESRGRTERTYDFALPSRRRGELERFDV